MGPQRSVLDEISNFFTAVSDAQTGGMVESKPSPANESSVNDVRDDQDAGSEPPRPESPLTLSDLSWMSDAQEAGRPPLTDGRFETSNTNSLVKAVHEEGRGPDTPESPLTLRRVRDPNVDQEGGKLPVSELSREISNLAKEVSAEY